MNIINFFTHLTLRVPVHAGTLVAAILFAALGATAVQARETCLQASFGRVCATPSQSGRDSIRVNGQPSTSCRAGMASTSSYDITCRVPGVGRVWVYFSQVSRHPIRYVIMEATRN